MMTEKLGRKALFAAPAALNGNGFEKAAEDQVAGAEIEEIAAFLQSVIAGGSPAGIDPGSFPANLRGLAEVVSHAATAIHEHRTVQTGQQIVFGESPMPMVTVDRGLETLDVNQAYCDLIGESRERILAGTGKKVAIKLLSGDKTEIVFSKGRKTLSVLEFTVGGEKKVLEQYGIPMPDESGEVVQALFVFNDITAVREKEREF